VIFGEISLNSNEKIGKKDSRGQRFKDSNP
jgi:hypothetical protein